MEKTNVSKSESLETILNSDMHFAVSMDGNVINVDINLASTEDLDKFAYMFAKVLANHPNLAEAIYGAAAYTLELQDRKEY